MARYYRIYLGVSEIISRRDDARNLSGGSKNSSTLISPRPDAYAAAKLRQRVQTMVDHHNIASTGQADWYPVAFFLRDEVLGGLRGSSTALSPARDRTTT